MRFCSTCSEERNEIGICSQCGGIIYDVPDSGSTIGDLTRPCSEIERAPDACETRHSRVPARLRLSFETLTSLKEHLRDSLGTPSWSEASALVGPRIASIVKTLVTTANWDFVGAVYDRFCPLGLQPAVWTENPDRVEDLAVRAVHAHALLGRFHEYLQYVQDLSELDAYSDDDSKFEPDDLLAEMVRSAVRDHRGHAVCGRAHRRPHCRRVESLFQLILHEAAKRLDCDGQITSLSNRVAKHMPLFRDLVSLVQLG